MSQTHCCMAPTLLYCFKCKRKTDTVDIEIIEIGIIKMKNFRKMVTGKCIMCGSKKCSFVKIFWEINESE
jgi:hypothetical protein